MDYLFQNEDRLKTIINLTPDIIYTLSPEGIITFLSPSFERITGFKKKQWIGRHFSELVHPNDKEQAEKIIKDWPRKRTVVLHELRIISRDGSYKVLEFTIASEIVNGKLIGKIGMGRDITRHKESEAKLKESRDNLEIILKNIADGIVVQDGNGKVMYVNDAVVRAAGCSSMNTLLKQKNLYQSLELKTQDGMKFKTQNLPNRRALAEGEDSEEIVNYRNMTTGEEKWSHIKARPIKNNKGKVVTVVTIINDITQRKELERKKDDFISIASHELKTPVTSIKGYVHLLKKAHKPRDEHVRYLEKVELQVERLTNLIKDLLDLSVIRSEKLVFRNEKFEFSELAQEVVDDLQRTNTTHRIMLETNGIKKVVSADRDKISQVLANIIMNAIKYSPGSDKVKVKLLESPEHVGVAVRDYGIGISHDEKDKIFDRFYRTKDARAKTYPGLGIGLYLSRQIVVKYNGKIWAETKRDQGTTFCFRLPAESI